MEGTATNGTGVEGFSSSGDGVFGSSGDFSVVGQGNISSDPGSISADTGVKGTSTNANGVYGFSTNRNAGAFENNNGSFFTLYSQADNASGFPLGAVNNSTGASLTFASTGNLTISGNLFTGSGTCHTGCSAARHPLTYTPAQSLPTMEDFGEAQLVNGQAYVHLDPAYANVIDSQTNYLVFITPEGDSNGVYVTQKTSSGFLVRENRGGHSALAFSYRIVAKPLGENAIRLPMIDDRARLAAIRMGASDPRMLSVRRQPQATGPARHWSAQKQAIANNPFLTQYGALRVRVGHRPTSRARQTRSNYADADLNRSMTRAPQRGALFFATSARNGRSTPARSRRCFQSASASAAARPRAPAVSFQSANAPTS